jgi:hypothetical protein
MPDERSTTFATSADGVSGVLATASFVAATSSVPGSSCALATPQGDRVCALLSIPRRCAYRGDVKAFHPHHRCAVLLAAGSLVMAACGSDADNSSNTSGPCAEAPPPQKVTGACEITLSSPPIQVAQQNHVPEGTHVTYCSNPPSSGAHYPEWADFQVFSNPIEEPYLVHSLEHGAVILYWKCTATPCVERPELVTPLREIRDNVPADPMCSGGVRARIIVAPSMTIPSDIAAAAWGATYQAPCVDRPSLEAFIRDHSAKGPENICFAGRTF